MSIARTIELLQALPQQVRINGLTGPGFGPPSPGDSPLHETTDFGANPGNLRMWTFVPPRLRKRAPLVVVLHGCAQGAGVYDVGSGWSDLARRHGFALLYPEQKKANNPQLCFNWFVPDDVTRNHGEAGSIRQMIARMIHNHRIDSRRIFVTGLSAGGAMALAMLATYPELFARGAVIAGLPFGVARNVQEALRTMLYPLPPAIADLGDRVRRASTWRGPWPRLSIWQGTADRTVNPANAEEIAAQWLDLHDVPVALGSEATIDGHRCRVWRNGVGEPVVELTLVSGMAHGVPLGRDDDDEPLGKPGPYLIEAGISSTQSIARFFGLVPAARHQAPAGIPAADRLATEDDPQSFIKVGRRKIPVSATGRIQDAPRKAGIISAITRMLNAVGLFK